MRFRFPVGSFLLTAAALIACGDDTTNGATTNGGGGSGAGSGTGAGTPTSTTTTGTGGADVEACPAPEPAHPGVTSTVGLVEAVAIDQNGDPAEGVDVTICGTNVCSETEVSDADGTISIDSDDLELDDARFNLGFYGLEDTKLSAPITEAAPIDFGTVRVIRLPEFAQGVAFATGTDVTQGDATLSIAGDAEIEHDLLAFPQAGQQVFRSAVVDIGDFDAAELPSVDESLGIEVILGLGPLGTHICPGAGLSFANVAEWPADAEVDIYIHGTKTYDHYAPYGAWAKVADAVVSANGERVETAEGQGIESLGTYGAALAR